MKSGLAVLFLDIFCLPTGPRAGWVLLGRRTPKSDRGAPNSGKSVIFTQESVNNFR